MSQAIGIDIGGSKTAIALVDYMTGGILAEDAFATPALAETGEPYLDLMRRSVARLRRNTDISKIGIGLCELVDNSGKVVSAHRVDVTEDQLRRTFSDFDTVAIESDVHAASIAEARFGAGRGAGHWIYVNAGTGISSVLMAGDEGHAGAHGWGACLGMSPIDLGRTAPAEIIEDRAGAAGLLHRASQAGLSFATPRELLAAAENGDAKAARILAEGGHVLGGAIAFIVNMLDPQRIVVGGGLASLDGPYWRALVAAMRAGIWHGPAKQVEIHRSALAGKAGVIGAALAKGRS